MFVPKGFILVPLRYIFELKVYIIELNIYKSVPFEKAVTAFVPLFLRACNDSLGFHIIKLHYIPSEKEYEMCESQCRQALSLSVNT